MPATKPKKRHVCISYRISPAEEAIIERNAEPTGMTVTTFLRTRCLDPTPPKRRTETPDQTRGKKTGIFVSPEEHRRITRNATAAGFESTSEWLRQKGMEQ